MCFKSKKTIIGVLLTCWVWVGSEAEGEEGMQKDRERYLSQITVLCRSRDSKGLSLITGSLEEKLAGSQQKSAGTFLRTICDEISSYEFPNDEQQILKIVEDIAIVALDTANVSEMETKLHLLNSYLRINDNKSRRGKHEWAQARTESARRWLSVWKELDEAIDKKWNEKDAENEIHPYVPPDNVNITLVGGMSPDSISDPQVRAAYEAHLAENSRISSRNHLQRKLRILKSEYAKAVEDYLIGLYSKEPFNLEELRNLLDGVFAEDKEKRIMDTVAENARQP